VRAAVEAGLGVLEAVAAGGEGRVVGLSRRAAYVRLPGGLVALVTPEVGMGPLHLRGPWSLAGLAVGDRAVVVAGRLEVGGQAAVGGRLPGHSPAVGDRPAVAGLAMGDRAVVVNGRLEAGPLAVDVAAAAEWRGPLPEPDALAAPAGRDLTLDALAVAPPSALAGRPLPDPTDLVGAVTALSGLGPGLTPAGDDVLAGLLLVARALGGPAAEPSLLAAARSARTGDVALALVHWAARGQCVEPAHRLLVAAAAGDAPGAAAAVAALARLGHTSGADLCLGLRLALDASVDDGASRVVTHRMYGPRNRFLRVV
jgi:hypothetical protein